MSNKTLKVNNFLTWTTIRFIWLNLSGVWTKAKVKWQNDGGTWRAIHASLSVTAGNCNEVDQGFGNPGVVSGGLDSPVVVSDEVGSIGYSWTHTGTTNGTTPSINSTTTSTPTWTNTVDAGIPSVSTWLLTITDQTSGAIATVGVQVRLTWAQLD